MPLVALSTAVFIGVCLYAGIHFLLYALNSRNMQLPYTIHILFSLLALITVGYMLSELVAYGSTNAATYVSAYRWRSLFEQFFLVIWPWFVFFYTGNGPRALVAILSIAAFITIPPNTIMTFGTFFNQMPEVQTITYSWGEEITTHQHTAMNIYSYIDWLVVIAAFIYTYYACYKMYINGRRRAATMLICAVSFFIIFVLENLLVRTGVFDFIYLAHFGFFCIIVLMSITLHHQAERAIRQNAEKFKTLFNTAADAIFIMEGSRFVDCNESTLEMFGCERDDIVGNTPMAFSPPIQYGGQDSRQKAKEKIQAAVNGEPQHFKWIHNRLDGSLFDAEVSLNHIRLNGKNCVQAIVRDVTAKRKGDSALQTIAVGVTGQSGDIFFNQMTQSLIKLFDARYAFIAVLNEEEPMLVDMLAFCIDGKIVENMSYRLESTPCENVVGHNTCAYPDKVQELFPKDEILKEMEVQSYIGAPIFDSDNKPLGLVVVLDTKPMRNLAQVTPILEIFAARAGAELERIQANEYIRRLAYRDYLTNLYNRAALHEHLSDKLRVASEGNLIGALIIIDLDHFKTINDALSHDVGDDVLRKVGQRLIEAVGEDVFLARIGGDEFAAVISDNGNMSVNSFYQSVSRLAEEIANALELPMQLGERILNIGASLGAAIFPDHGDHELDILRHADMALHLAKNKGRGNVQFYEASLQKIVDERLHIERGLRQAIDLNELTLAFQPQISAEGDVIGAEVLLRWHNPELGHVSPAQFIPVAEETGLIHSIGRWVMENTWHQLSSWKDKGITYDGKLSVNVSAWQFANSEFVNTVKETLSQYQIDPNQIVLELTETALLYDIQETIDKLAQLRKFGVRIALDDFGTGYSSLAYLKDMEMDLLKIDQVFISELTQENEHPLVESIIAMGQHMNLEVIAEGVETEEQWKILRELGCEMFQGYHFCRPLGGDDFIRFVQNR